MVFSSIVNCGLSTGIVRQAHLNNQNRMAETRSTNSKPHLNHSPGQAQGFRWLLFFSRVAFICNICFLFAFSVQLTDWIRNEDVKSTIALIGYVMGFVINPVLNLCYILLFLVSRKRLKIVPSWLLTANILFFVIQILYILYLNDKQHS